MSGAAAAKSMLGSEQFYHAYPAFWYSTKTTSKLTPKGVNSAEENMNIPLSGTSIPNMRLLVFG
jgi:hypothetical protein